MCIRDRVVIGALVDIFLQRGGNEALVAVGAVVGHNDQTVGSLPHFIFQDNQILITEAGDHIHLGSHGMQSLGLGISDGAAGAAADDGGLLVAFQLRGLRCV